MNFKIKYRPESWGDWVGKLSEREARRLLQEPSGYIALTEGIGGGKSTKAYLMTKSRFCEAQVESWPCTTCPRCRAVQDNWWRTGSGPIWMPGQRFGTSDWFRVYDCTTMLPTDVKQIREEYRTYGLLPRVYVFDELHRAQVPTQERFLKLLEEDLPGFLIFCIAKEHLGKITKALLQRLYVLDIGKPEPEELMVLLKRIVAGEEIDFTDSMAADYLIEECDSVRELLNALEIIVADGQGFTMPSVKRAAARVRLVRTTKEADL